MLSIQDFAKVTPVLVGGALLLSITYEAAYFYPLGLRFLAYFDTHDFIRSIFVWLPAYLAFGAVDLFFAGITTLNRKLDEELRMTEQIRVSRGLPPVPAATFRATMRLLTSDVLSGLRKWQLYLAILAFLIAFVNLTILPHPPIAFGFLALGIYFLFLCSRQFFADFLEAAIESSRQRTYWITVFITAFAVAAIWGGTQGRSDMARPEAVRVQLSGSPNGDNTALQCNVLRHLSSSFIAICSGKVIAVKSSDVWLLKYDVPALTPR